MIDVDAAGPAAPPRDNGELVFAAPWEGRVFGMCVALLERHGIGWDRLRRHLVPRRELEPDRPYYEHLTEALEALVAELESAR